ncbi:MAG: hypothetical protein V7L13_23320 [Nostoc sp.]
MRLRRRDSNHFGIIVCTNNRNREQFAAQIDEAVTAEAEGVTKRLKPRK